MPVSTLDTTVGGASANAYCTRAFADQYHLDRPAPSVAWATYTSDQKDASILWATILLDSLYEWYGYVASPTQALLFPRSGLVYRNGFVAVPNTVIPVEIQRGCAEFARQLAATDRAADNDVETQGIKALTAGPVSIQFKDDVRAKVVPDAVRNLIPRDWGFIHGRSGSANLEGAERGVSSGSAWYHL